MRKLLTSALIGLLTLAGCGGDGGESTPAGLLTGKLMFSAVEGLHYQTFDANGALHYQGTTDENGEYQYFEGDTIEFWVGDDNFRILLAKTDSDMDLELTGAVTSMVARYPELNQSIEIPMVANRGMAAQNSTFINLSSEARAIVELTQADDSGLSTARPQEQTALETNTVLNIAAFLTTIDRNGSSSDGIFISDQSHDQIAAFVCSQGVLRLTESDLDGINFRYADPVLGSTGTPEVLDTLVEKQTYMWDQCPSFDGDVNDNNNQERIYRFINEKNLEGCLIQKNRFPLTTCVEQGERVLATGGELIVPIEDLNVDLPADAEPGTPPPVEIPYEPFRLPTEVVDLDFNLEADAFITPEQEVNPIAVTKLLNCIDFRNIEAIEAPSESDQEAADIEDLFDEDDTAAIELRERIQTCLTYRVYFNEDAVIRDQRLPGNGAKEFLESEVRNVNNLIAGDIALDPFVIETQADQAKPERIQIKLFDPLKIIDQVEAVSVNPGIVEVTQLSPLDADLVVSPVVPEQDGETTVVVNVKLENDYRWHRKNLRYKIAPVEE